MEIIQKPVPSYQIRGTQRPMIIVNHISVGTLGSMYNHFLNKNNRASSHFGIGRDGSIVQYVDIKKAAWTQGRIQYPTAPIIKSLKGNPNLYAVSIEHEGYAGNGLEGDLTEEQFWATCWLHKYIQEQVQIAYGVTFDLNSHHVLGHFQIDSKGKPNCPGQKFPWSNLYAELVYANAMDLDDYTEHISFKGSIDSSKIIAFAFASRVSDLKTKLTSKYGVEARRKLMLLAPIMEELSYSTFFKELHAEGIAARVGQLYADANNDKWVKDAVRKLMIGANYAKEKGLL